MNSEQQEALKKISNTGTVMIIAGVFGIFYSIFIGLLSLLFFFSPPSSSSTYSSSTDSTTAGIVFGVVFLILAVISLALAIVEIVAGLKLRKPSANSKGWVIFSLVAGILTILAAGIPGWIMGILMVVFSTMALGSFNVLGGQQPAKTTIENK